MSFNSYWVFFFYEMVTVIRYYCSLCNIQCNIRLVTYFLYVFTEEITSIYKLHIPWSYEDSLTIAQ